MALPKPNAKVYSKDDAQKILQRVRTALGRASASMPPPSSTEGWSEWVRLESSNLAQVRYNESDALLEVQFKSGSVYRYITVPVTVWDALLRAPSHGKYFNRAIKNNYSTHRMS
jgi:hypothetical protein